MEKNLNLSKGIIVIFAILLSVSCTKDSNSDGFYFRATIDGTKNNASTYQAFIAEGTTNVLHIYARWGSNELTGIDLDHFNFSKTVGEYVIKYPGSDVKGLYKAEAKQFNNSEGKLIVDSVEKGTIKGTFEFVATQSTGEKVTITEGEFYLPLQVISINENTPDVAIEIKKIASDKMINQIKNSGMEIHEGNTPPSIEGIYLSSPHTLMVPYVGDFYSIGHRFPDYKLRFYDQKNGKISLDFKASDAQGTGQGAYVTGNGNKFTIYAQTYVVERGIANTTSSVYSGEITPEGIVNYKAAYVLTWKENDPNNRLMPVGAFRVSGDGDRMSEKITTY